MAICFYFSLISTMHLMKVNTDVKMRNVENEATGVNLILQTIYENFKEIRIIDGVASSNDNARYVIASPIRGLGDLLVVDTSEQGIVKNSQAFVRISKNEIIFGLFEEHQMMKFKDLAMEKGNFTFDRNDLAELVEKYQKMNSFLIPFLFFPLFAIFTFLRAAFSILLISHVTHLFYKKISIDELKKLMTLIQGPVLTLAMIGEIFAVDLGSISMICFMFYVTFAIHAVKS